ncbi:MAG: DUF2939 domain-containing protein [Verrucomicrobiaceae bacterium]|nr:MAG: DUF2939 domain-containing protein [Verrucomicrobiaceae bacterium]
MSGNMEIHIERSGKKYGPYSQSEVRKHLASGVLVPTDLAWHKGLADWTQLAALFPATSGVEGVATNATPVGVPPRASALYRRRIVLTSLILLVLIYTLSPYVALWRLNAALHSGKSERLETHIDFPSVRAGLKKDLRAHLTGSLAKGDSSKDSSFADLAAAIAPTLMDGVIDSMVTPSGVVLLMAQEDAAKSPSKTDASGEDSGSEKIDWSQIRYAFFTGPTSFLLDVEGVKVRMQLSGIHWKVTQVEVNPATFDSLVN